MRIRTKLITGFLVVALVPVIALAILDHTYMRSALTDEAGASLHCDARMLAHHMDGFLNNNLDRIRTQARFLDPALFPSLPAEQGRENGDRHPSMEEALQAYARSQPSFIESYALLDREGINVIDTRPEGVGADESGWDYFQKPMEDGRPHATLAFKPPGQAGMDGLFFSAAVKNGAGEVMGVLRAHYQASILQHQIRTSLAEDMGGLFAVLLDEYQIRLGHTTRPELRFKSLAPLPADEVKRLKEAGRLPDLPADELATGMTTLAERLKNMENQPFFSIDRPSEEGNEQLVAASVSLSLMPWRVVLAKPESLFLEPVNTQLRSTLVVILLACAFVVIAAFLVAQYLARPMVRLTLGATRVAEGDLNIREEINTRDEVGELAAAFNRMTDNIRKTMGGLHQEITERKKVEEALRSSEEQYRLFLQNFEGIAYTARLDKFEPIFMYGIIEKITGYQEADFTSRRITWDQIIHPDDLERVGHQLEKLRDQPGYVADEEYRIRHKKGEIRWVRDIGRSIWDEAGKNKLVQGVVYDISRHKETDERNRLQQQKLIQADKMISLGFLLSGVAHEINNPNHIIMAHVSPLLKAWKQAEPILAQYHDEVGEFSLAGMPFLDARAEIPAMFTAMLEGSNRIKVIVNELRDYARERPAEMTEMVHINHVVKSAVTLCTNMLHKATKRFSADFGDALPPVQGNYQRLEQVVINLVQNACQSLSRKEACIRVSTGYDPDARTVVLKVKDEGVGIPAESLDHITDPFFTTKRDTGGTGLGLSISYSIILEHRGNLTFESLPRQGTTATVTLPVEEENHESKASEKIE